MELKSDCYSGYQPHFALLFLAIVPQLHREANQLPLTVSRSDVQKRISPKAFSLVPATPPTLCGRLHPLYKVRQGILRTTLLSTIPNSSVIRNSTAYLKLHLVSAYIILQVHHSTGGKPCSLRLPQ